MARRPSAIRKLTGGVNIEDEAIFSRKKRIAPISKSPFQPWTLNPDDDPTIAAAIRGTALVSGVVASAGEKDAAGSSQEDLPPAEQEPIDLPVGERPPTWLELSNDLAWTATFASLTSNTNITSSNDIFSYGVFFAMVWQLWSTQLVYDLKFFTNDWFHRIFFVIQLMIYGALAAFTNQFNVFWKLGADDPPPEFTYAGTQLYLSANAVYRHGERTKELTFQGLTILFSLSRFFLLVQYARVIYYRRQHRMPWKKYLRAPIALAISCILFFACFLVLVTSVPSHKTTVIQYVLWSLAMVIEAVGHWFNPDDLRQNLIGYGSLTDRLSTLTVIILGEGLNGLCGTLRFSVNAIGFGWRTGIQILSVVSILYFFWLIYFGGFRNRRLTTKLNTELYIFSHLVFLLSVILILDGVKNMLLLTNLVQGLDDIYNRVIVNIADRGLLERHPATEKTLEKLGISWVEQINWFKEVIGDDISLQKEWMRFILTVFYQLFESYTVNMDPQVVGLYVEYVTYREPIDADIAFEAQNSDPNVISWPNLFAILEKLGDPYATTTHWISAVSGVVLMSIAFLNWVQDRPRDRYAWAGIVTKLVGGSVLIIMTSFHLLYTEKTTSNTGIVLALPILSVVYVLVGIADTVLLYRSVEAIDEVQNQPTSEITPGEEKRRLDLNQLDGRTLDNLAYVTSPTEGPTPAANEFNPYQDKAASPSNTLPQSPNRGNTIDSFKTLRYPELTKPVQRNKSNRNRSSSAPSPPPTVELQPFPDLRL